MHRHFRTVSLRLAAAMLVATSVAACSGGMTPAPGQATFAEFATATNQQCVTPSTSAQTVALPSTGGVTATISFGAYSSAATGCDPVTISTGVDATSAVSFVRSSRGGVRDATTSANPLLTITVGEGFGSSGPFGPFGYPSIVSGVKLDVSAMLNFPDGTYYGSVVVDNKTFVIPFTASGGTLSVASSGAGALPILIVANASAVITIYPRGVMPPASAASPTPSPVATVKATPSAVPTATPVPSPTGSASAAPSPTAHASATPASSASPSTPSPTPGPTGANCPPMETACYGNTPPAAAGTTLGTYSVNNANANCMPPQGVSSCNRSAVQLTQASYDGSETGTANPFAEIEYPFYGTITYTYANTQKYLSYTLVGCPADWQIVIAQDLSSGSITIPSTDPAEYSNNGTPNGCYIQYSTVPPGTTPTPPFQSYYEVLSINPVQPI